MLSLSLRLANVHTGLKWPSHFYLVSRSCLPFHCPFFMTVMAFNLVQSRLFISKHLGNCTTIFETSYVYYFLFYLGTVCQMHHVCKVRIGAS
jgi:hypothetical protein